MRGAVVETMTDLDESLAWEELMQLGEIGVGEQNGMTMEDWELEHFLEFILSEDEDEDDGDSGFISQSSIVIPFRSPTPISPSYMSSSHARLSSGSVMVSTTAPLICSNASCSCSPLASRSSAFSSSRTSYLLSRIVCPFVPPSSTPPAPAPPHIHTVDPLYFPMITLISFSVLFSTPVFFSLSFRYAYIEPVGALAPRSCSTVYYPPASSEYSLCRFPISFLVPSMILNPSMEIAFLHFFIVVVPSTGQILVILHTWELQLDALHNLQISSFGSCQLFFFLFDVFPYASSSTTHSNALNNGLDGSTDKKTNYSKYGTNLDADLNQNTEDRANEKSSNFTQEEIQEFEQENRKIYEEYTSSLNEIQSIEKKMVEISRLQDVLTDNLLTQDESIDRVADSTVNTTENVKQGNVEILQALQHKAGVRVWMLFILIVLTFSLLFLDWYNP
ncbi:unnamed protein product [Gordionus sp. m RMFG-2023]